jgi:predicted O-methyltransferase YrrM
MATSSGAADDDRPIFTAPWFNAVRPKWDQLIPHVKPSRILEIGSYEGASACYLIETLATERALEIHCVDSWAGGVEHASNGQFEADMAAVEARFHRNTRLAIAKAGHAVSLTVHKEPSDIALARLLAEGRRGHFDFVYVDGSHEAPDVLGDAVLGFKLLRVGGVMAFDDYLWVEKLPQGRDLLRCPKPAIDAFVNLHLRKLDILRAPLWQLYVRKIAE